MLEVIAATTCWLILHEVILSSHALAHRATRRGLLWTQDDTRSIVHDGRKLSCVIECASIDQIELRAGRALPALVLSLCRIRWSCLLAYVGRLLRRTDALIHGQIILINVQRYALYVWSARGTTPIQILNGHDLLLGDNCGIVLLLIGQLLLEAIIRADTEVSIRVNRAL